MASVALAHMTMHCAFRDVKGLETAPLNGVSFRMMCTHSILFCSGQMFLSAEQTTKTIFLESANFIEKKRVEIGRGDKAHSVAKK